MSQYHTFEKRRVEKGHVKIKRVRTAHVKNVEKRRVESPYQNRHMETSNFFSDVQTNKLKGDMLEMNVWALTNLFRY